MRRHAAFWKVSFTFPRKWYLPSFENTRFRKVFCPCLIGYSSNSYASPPPRAPTAALATCRSSCSSLSQLYTFITSTAESNFR